MENHTYVIIFLLIVIVTLFAIMIGMLIRRKKTKPLTTIELGDDDCIVVDKRFVKVYQAGKPVNLPLTPANQEQIQIFPGKKKKMVRIE